jgi:hypothetical protein
MNKHAGRRGFYVECGGDIHGIEESFGNYAIEGIWYTTEGVTNF